MSKKKCVPRGIPLEQFVRKIDYAAQINEGVKTLLKDCLMVEHDFRTALGIPADRFRRAVDSGDFDNNQVKHAGKTYWGTALNVGKIRSMQEVYR